MWLKGKGDYPNLMMRCFCLHVSLQF